MAATIEGLLSEISSSEDPLEGLRNLRTAVLSTPVNNLRELGSGCNLEVIFSLLNTADKEQIEVCVEVLGRILQAQDPALLFHARKTELEGGLQHPDDTVKILTLTQMGRVVENGEALTQMLACENILRKVIQCIAAEKISVAKEAISALAKLAHCKPGLDALFRTHLKDVKDVMATSDIIRYRVYELVVEVCAVSAVSLGYCASTGFISQLLEEMAGDDILVRATAIETVTHLAEFQHGRQYLSQQGTMERLSNMIIAAEQDPFSSLYLPGLVKFFGKLALLEGPQQVCECYPAFLSTVFEMLLGPDPTHTTVALDTVGALGATVEGKQVLHKTGEKFKAVLKRMSHIAQDGPNDLRVRCIDAIALLLSLPSEDQTEDLCVLTESWFCSLSSQPMEMFRTISTQPFPELHCCALRVFTAIGSQAWGQRMMVQTPGFLEWIVDRSSGVTKEGKDAKFELVGALVTSPTTQELLGSQNTLRLRAYLREGPYYVSAVAAVSTEGAD
ncbi:26S proteasome non-ATPase regulatory subunit 5 isoform X2 [Engraulis encrasicolus]|uniref:26S proteasome non-ATPase regulatory subunit 5 isoform X2 n=1 Tax=Engraulis encrasicolus TaxID=184585 RepID=UPI002FCEF87C